MELKKWLWEEWIIDGYYPAVDTDYAGGVINAGKTIVLQLVHQETGESMAHRMPTKEWHALYPTLRQVTFVPAPGPTEAERVTAKFSSTEVLGAALYPGGTIRKGAARDARGRR